MSEIHAKFDQLLAAMANGEPHKGKQSDKGEGAAVEGEDQSNDDPSDLS